LCADRSRAMDQRSEESDDEKLEPHLSG